MRWSLLVAAFAVACADHQPEIERVGGDPLPDGGSVPDNAIFPCEIGDIVRTVCHRCHSDMPERSSLAGPFRLLEWKDTQQLYVGRPVWERMKEVIESGFMPYTGAPKLDPPVEPLTAGQKDLMLEWLDAGAPPLDGDEIHCP